jgi:hypothetical protein
MAEFAECEADRIKPGKGCRMLEKNKLEIRQKNQNRVQFCHK